MSNRWSVCPKMTIGRASHSLCVINDWIYAICGQSDLGPLSTIERLQVSRIGTEQSMWQKMQLRAPPGSEQAANLDTEDDKYGEGLLPPRMNLMAAPIGSQQIVILGGYSASMGFLGDAYILNTTRNDETNVLQ